MGKKIYEKSFKEKLVKLHLEEGRSVASLTKEYGLGQGSLNIWIKNYRKECSQTETGTKDLELLDKIRKLERENKELEKENNFLKKAAAFFAKEIED
ncbi:transposase [Desulfonispora thiosulfatigenes DSM 11270]|uniref:Transposase n=1 Tax=Desulfonispora thiosulfatigenes DSM 11270 TaxID=656914 RepID=A0A1W1UCW4_DESTI|nr:transposase [Desulfonispora thiosulfatigenes DSM 11270]